MNGINQRNQRNQRNEHKMKFVLHSLAGGGGWNPLRFFRDNTNKCCLFWHHCHLSPSQYPMFRLHLNIPAFRMAPAKQSRNRDGLKNSFAISGSLWMKVFWRAAARLSADTPALEGSLSVKSIRAPSAIPGPPERKYDHRQPWGRHRTQAR